ncbi:hypothetical protein BDV32DRAFT_118191 [Aspergillus pseudonomiae]|nr:hypothetical protein BDV32DRAFT_118191 [Aspergillus pseudonomiae]
MAIPVLFSTMVTVLMHAYAGTIHILYDGKAPPVAQCIVRARNSSSSAAILREAEGSDWPDSDGLIADAVFCGEYGLSCHCFIDYSRNRLLSIAVVATIEFWCVFESDGSGCPDSTCM